MAHVEYSEVSDPEYLSYERKGCYSYIKDQVGTIIKVYKHETKQMINTRTYDTFGNMVNQTGSSSGNLGFQSKYYDQESGLNYYYHRYYYPSIGRFINEDPIGMSGGLNMYDFVRNNPIKWIDPFGLDFLLPGQERRKILDDYDPSHPDVDASTDMALDILNVLSDWMRNFDEHCYYVCFWKCMALNEGLDFFLSKLKSKITLDIIKMNLKAGRKKIAQILINVVRISSNLDNLLTGIEAYLCHQKCKDKIPNGF